MESQIIETQDGGEIDARKPGRIIWELAWPSIALNSLQTLNGLLDTFYTGQLHSSALTAVGASINVMFLLFSMTMCISVSATALVSRFFGAKEYETMREAARNCVSFARWSGLVLLLVCSGLALLGPLVFIPKGNAEAALEMRNYLLAAGLAIPSLAVIQTLAGCMRGIGDARSPLIISGFQVALHALLNSLFIFPAHWSKVPLIVLGPLRLGGSQFYAPGLGWGLSGAAGALAVSAAVSSIGYLWWANRTALGSVGRQLLPTASWAKRILKIAIPAAGQAILRVSSLAMFTIILTMLPMADASLGAIRIGFTIESMMFMPAFGLSMAASALVGQSLGMRDPLRAERLGWKAGHYAGILIFVVSIPIFFGANLIANLLTGGNKPEIAMEAANLIRILIYTEFLFGYAMVMTGGLQGAGETKRPLWLTAISMWGVRVPLAYVLAIIFRLGANGAWAAMSVSQALNGILLILAWREGKWKLAKV